MKGIITKYLVIFFITLSCTALIATTFTACGGGGSGTTTEDAVDTSGEDVIDEGTVDGGPTAEELVADALAKIAINSALKIGLGINTGEDWAFEGLNLIGCGDGSCMNEETTANCPADCSCGDGMCDTSETAASCPADCPLPVCGDGQCFQEEFVTGSCPAECSEKFGNLIRKDSCADTGTYNSKTIYRNADGTSELFASGFCTPGYDNDDLARADVAALFVDVHIGVTDIVINGITFTCVERTSPQECMEGSAQIVFMPDGTFEIHTALSGKLYAYREASSTAADGDAIAKVIVGAAASGTLTMPSSVDVSRWPYVSVTYDAAEAHYLEPDGSIAAPDHEVCQSFMIDWTLINTGWWFGPPDGVDWPYDEDGNGLAGCADPACAAHPACLMSYCPPDTGGYSFNFHGTQEHPSCGGPIGICGDGTCDAEEDVTSCPADCTCGNHICEAGEDAISCSVDCDSCGNNICGKGEDITCPQDCD